MRYARKQALFAQSDDVQILFEILKNLHEIILGYQSQGARIDCAVVSTPHIAALYEEDILDAINLWLFLPQTLLRSINGPDGYDQPRALLAGFAGYGLGLCSNYTDIDSCGKENSKMPERRVFMAEWSSTSLHLRLKTITVAMMEYEPADDEFTITDLQHGCSCLNDRPDKDNYWAEVRILVAELPRKNFQAPKITDVILLGDCAMGPVFWSIVHDAIMDFQDSEPVFHDSDPVFAAAKGSAELGKREIYRQEQVAAKMGQIRENSAMVELR